MRLLPVRADSRILAAVPIRARAAIIAGEPWSHDEKAPGELGAFVVIDPDNSIALRVARSAMGQGVLTSLAMILAEELECDFDKARVEYASAHRNPVENGIYESTKVRGRGLLQKRLIVKRHSLVRHRRFLGCV